MILDYIKSIGQIRLIADATVVQSGEHWSMCMWVFFAGRSRASRIRSNP